MSFIVSSFSDSTAPAAISIVAESPALYISSRISFLEKIITRLRQAANVHEKLVIVDEIPAVGEFLQRTDHLRVFMGGLTPDCEFAIKSVIAIGQGENVFRVPEQMQDPYASLREMLHQLLAVENFYQEIGGIIGYHLVVLKLIGEEFSGTAREASPSLRRYDRPRGVDVSQESPETARAIVWGLQALPNTAEIYPIGGAGDRLGLHEEKGDRPLPAACLQFAGRSLLEGMIRDLQAREYLYYRLFDKQLMTPIVMMTSNEKNNHAHVLEICEGNGWFGRSSECFFIFTQSSAPVLTKEGNWCMKGPHQILLKPGGHGVIWKLMEQYQAYQWLKTQGYTKALIRQINNPVAGTDYGLLAFTGIGWHRNKAFGFASCNRLVGTAEGTDVYFEEPVEGGYLCGISNIEYTDFRRNGIEDQPAKLDTPYSKYPSNTNILFADLKAVEQVLNGTDRKELPSQLQKCLIPGMMINMKKKEELIDSRGVAMQMLAGRLESMMQNIADFFVVKRSTPLPEGEVDALPVYMTLNKRRKTISVTKKSYVPGSSLQETPEGGFYDLLANARELLSEECGMLLPDLGSAEEYLQRGPGFYVLMHPGLGPLYSIIKQKIRGGKLRQGAEMQLEISELDMENLDLEGSLLIEAEQILGQKDSKGVLRYGKEVGRCTLIGVKVKNRGIDRNAAQVYWKNQLVRHESLRIRIEGNGEFYAKGVLFTGDQEIIVPDGYRITMVQEGGRVVQRKEPITQPTWQWKYQLTEDHRILLSVAK